MAGKVLSEEAGRALAAQVKERYGTEVAVSGLQIQLKNGVKDSSGAKVVLSTATIPVATQSVAGAMSAGDKAKLDGIAAGAKPYGKAGKNVLGLVMTTSGAEDTAVKASGSGYAPTPIVDGVPYFHDTTYVAATQSAPGLMTAADKKKLDGVASGANAYSLPAASSTQLGGVKVGSGLACTGGVLSTVDASPFTVLFSSDAGTAGDFSLYADASAYSVIEVVYGNGTRRASTSCVNGDDAHMSLTAFNDQASWQYVGALRVSGKSCSWQGNSTYNPSSGSWGAVAQGELRVFKVIGWAGEAMDAWEASY